MRIAVMGAGGLGGYIGARLAEAGDHPWLGDYPLLARAALALAEGRTQDARATVARWHDALERTGLARSITVGNEWALDRIAAALAAPAA